LSTFSTSLILIQSGSTTIPSEHDSQIYPQIWGRRNQLVDQRSLVNIEGRDMEPRNRYYLFLERTKLGRNGARRFMGAE
jgi:hypothetical protein